MHDEIVEKFVDAMHEHNHAYESDIIICNLKGQKIPYIGQSLLQYHLKMIFIYIILNLQALQQNEIQYKNFHLYCRFLQRKEEYKNICRPQRTISIVLDIHEGKRRDSAKVCRW